MPCESTTRSQLQARSRQLQSARALLRLAAPLHPLLVHFTIALTVIAFGFDLFAFLFGIGAWRSIGWWNLAAAVVVTLGTLATGVKSRLRLPLEEGEARSFLRLHMALGPMVFGLLVMLAFWRAKFWQAGVGVNWAYLVAMFLVLLAITAQGYVGGELVYRYGTAVSSRYRDLPGHHGRIGRPERRRAADDAGGGRSRWQP